MQNINTSFKLESLSELQGRINGLLESLDSTIKIKNIEFNDDAFKNQVNSITNMCKNLQNQINNSFTGIKLNDLHEVLSLVKELNQYNKGIKINFITEGLDSKIKESFGKEANAIKEFAKETGLSYSKELVGSIKQGMESGNLDSVFNTLANKGLEKLKESGKDEQAYMQGFLKSCDELESKLNSVAEVKQKLSNSKLDKVEFVDQKALSALNEASSKVTEIRNKNGELNKVIAEQKIAEGQVVTSIHKVNDATGKLEQNQSKIVTNYEQQAKAADKVVQEQERLNNKIQNFKNNMNAKLDTFNAKNSGLFNVEEFNRIKNAVNNFKPTSINECNGAVQKLNSEFRLMGASVAEAKSSTSGFFNTLKGTVSAALGYLGVGSVAFAAIDQLKNGIKYVSDMDNLISNLKITMNGTNQEFNNMVGQASRMADTLGSTTKDIMNVASIYANMGETIDSIMSKTKADVVLSNLAQLDSKETTDAMQAFFNQFNLGTKNVEKDAMMISDSMVAISKSMAMNFSQGIREMIEGVKTSGSVAKNAGFDLQHYEALIGTVAQVTRASGSEIGNAWKNILSRMGAVKPTTKKAAQDINKVEQSLKGVGVQLRSDKDTFRNAQDVLDDLSKKWGNLSQVQKAAIAEQMAGKMQINKFYAFLDNYGKYTELATKATHSQGEAMKANEIYLQSTEAKMKLLTNAMQEFFGAALKSNDLKVLIEMLTDIVHVATVVVDKFGLLGTVAGIMGNKMIMSSNGFKNLISTFKETQSASSALKTAFNGFENSIKVDNIKASFDNVKKSLAEVSVESKKTKNNIVKGLQDGTISIQKFDRNAKMIPKRMEEITRSGSRLGVVKTAIRNIGGETTRTTSKIYLLGKAFDVARIKATLFQAVASMGISLAIGAIVGGIGKLISKAHEGKQSLEEMTTALSDKSNQISTLDGLARKFDYLSKKTCKTKDDYKQLEHVQEQLAQQNPSLITGFNGEGKAISNNSKAVHELIKEKRDLLKAELQSQLNKSQANIDKQTKEYEKAKKSIKELTKELDFHKRAIKSSGVTEQEAARRTQSYSKELGKQAQKMRESKTEIDRYNSASKALARLEYDSAKAIISNINATKNKKISVLEAARALKEQGVEAKTAQRVVLDYAKSLNEATDGNKNLKDGVDSANDSLSEQANQLSSLSGKVDFYKKVLDEIKEHNAVSRDTFNTVVEKFPELLPVLANAATAQEKLSGMIKDTSKQYDDMANNVLNNADKILQAHQQASQRSVQAVQQAGSDISNIAQQTGSQIANESANTSSNIQKDASDTGNTISNESANASQNISNDSANASNDVGNAGNDMCNTASDTGNTVSSESANASQNVSNDAANASSDVSNSANDACNNVVGSANDSAQGATSAMDSAVNAMAQAYGVDVNNFANACNAKVAAANQAAAQIAAAFNAVMNQFSSAEKSFQSQGGVGGSIDNMRNGAERAHAMAQINAYHITVPHISAPSGGGHVSVGYSPSGSSHSAGGGGGRHRGGGGSGGGGRSPRRSSGGGGSGSGRHKSGSSGGGSKGSSGGSSETKKEVENLKLEIDRYKLINAEIARINEKLNRTKDLKEQAKGKEKVAFINQEVKETNELIDAQKRLQSEQDKQRNELKDKLAKNWFSFNKDGSIKDYQGSLKKLEDWANKATGDQKEKRIQLVKDLQKDADSYIELVSNKIPEVDNAIFKSTSNIKELLREVTKAKMDDFKKDFDKLIDGIQEKAKGLDVSEAMFGDKSYENNLDFLKHRINLADKEFQAKFKYLNQLKQLSKDSGQKDFDELNQAIKDANDSLDDGKIKVQQLREQYEKLNLEWKQSAFDDFKWQTQQKFDALDLSISKLTDSNTVGKINLLNEKLQLQQTSLKRTEQYIKQLRNTVVHTARGYEELIEKSKSTEEELNNQKNAVISLEKEMEGLVNDRISKYIDQIHKIEQLQLERKQKEEQLALEKDFFGISESKFEAYRNSRINALNEEIDLLRRKYEIEGANHKF